MTSQEARDVLRRLSLYLLEVELRSRLLGQKTVNFPLEGVTSMAADIMQAVMAMNGGGATPAPVQPAPVPPLSNDFAAVYQKHNEQMLADTQKMVDDMKANLLKSIAEMLAPQKPPPPSNP